MQRLEAFCNNGTRYLWCPTNLLFARSQQCCAGAYSTTHRAKGTLQTVWLASGPIWMFTNALVKNNMLTFQEWARAEDNALRREISTGLRNGYV